MRPISKKNRDIIAEDPYYKTCARSDTGKCKGRITIEHAIIFAGRQLDELWSLLPLCEYHHDVNTFQGNGDLNKQENVRIALNRATDEELEAISKAIDYLSLRDRLNNEHDKNA